MSAGAEQTVDIGLQDRLQRSLGDAVI